MDASTRAVTTAALAAGLAVAAYATDELLLALCGVVVIAFAGGWPHLASSPSVMGSRAVITLGGLGAVAAIWFTPGEPYLRALPLVFALAIVLAFVHELIRVDGRLRLVESVSATVTGVLIATSAAGWIAAGRTPGATDIVVTGAVTLAAASVLAALSLRPVLAAAATAGTAAAVGMGLGFVLPLMSPTSGALIGFSVGILQVTLHALFDRLPSLEGRWAAVAAIMLPVTVTGTLVYVVGRVLVG